MTAKEIAEELNDMLSGDIDEYGEEGMETTEDAVHEACAAVRAWERIGAELARYEADCLLAVKDPECRECTRTSFESLKNIISRAFEKEGLGLPDKERKKKKALEEEQKRQAQLDFCRSFREKDDAPPIITEEAVELWNTRAAEEPSEKRNLLRDLFKPTPEQQKRWRESYEKIVEKLKKERCCDYCQNAKFEPHYEHGKPAGSDCICGITGELRIFPGDNGKNCEHWGLADEVKE